MHVTNGMQYIFMPRKTVLIVFLKIIREQNQLPIGFGTALVSRILTAIGIQLLVTFNFYIVNVFLEKMQ